MKGILIVLGIIFGLAFAIATIAGAGYGLLESFPPAKDIDLSTVQGIEAYINSAMPEAKAIMVGAWAIAGLLGGWIAAIIARPRPGLAAITIGALLTCTVIGAAGVIRQPEWMPVVAMLLPIPFALLGWRLPPSSAEP